MKRQKNDNQKIQRYYRILLIIGLTVLIFASGYYITGKNKDRIRQEVNANTSSEDMVIPGGMPIGIYLETEGVMVLGTDKVTGTDGMTYEPATHLIKSGDYIVAFNHKSISGKRDLLSEMKQNNGEEVILRIRRKDSYINVRIKPAMDSENKSKLGIWVRDDTQGLGTITYLRSDCRFGALGHGIHDIDTSELLEISEGRVYDTSIRSIEKGTSGTPGGMEGIIVYNRYNILGTITKNTENGIYGTLDRVDSLFKDQTPMKILSKEKIKKGDAKIRCSVEGEVKEYDIRITKIDIHTKEVNKGLEIKVTDPKLLEITGGIVQGMSGSPIIQDGKIVGAVTHVFVQDASKGYGIFIENMLKNDE